MNLEEYIIDNKIMTQQLILPESARRYPNPELPQGFSDIETHTMEIQSREVNNLTADQMVKMGGITVAVLGLGVGGRVAEKYAQMGVRSFILGDGDSISPSNLGRQVGTWRDLVEGKVTHEGEEEPKATPKPNAVAELILDKNPHANIITIPSMLDRETIRWVVEHSDLVVWGLDTPQAIIDIHETAAEYSKPVVSGLDLGPWDLLRYYDYRDPNQAILDGLVSQETVDRLKGNPLASIVFLAMTVPYIERKVPTELMEDLRQILNGKKTYLSQTSLAVDVFAAYIVRMSAILMTEDPKKAGLKRELVVRNPYAYMERPQRIEYERGRIEMLKDPLVQKALALDGGRLTRARYAQAIAHGFVSALIGK